MHTSIFIEDSGLPFPSPFVQRNPSSWSSSFLKEIKNNFKCFCKIKRIIKGQWQTSWWRDSFIPSTDLRMSDIVSLYLQMKIPPFHHFKLFLLNVNTFLYFTTIHLYVQRNTYIHTRYATGRSQLTAWTPLLAQVLTRTAQDVRTVHCARPTSGLYNVNKCALIGLCLLVPSHTETRFGEIRCVQGLIMGPMAIGLWRPIHVLFI